MSHSPSDRELDRLLAKLPRQCASPGFSRRVLDGLERPARPRGGGRWLLATAAAAAALALGLWLLPARVPEPSLADTDDLREEHRLLMEELQSLKASVRASQTAPVLYLGGDEHLDLVLDLGPVWHDEPTAGFRPAVQNGVERPVATTDRRPGGRR